LQNGTMVLELCIVGVIDTSAVIQIVCSSGKVVVEKLTPVSLRSAWSSKCCTVSKRVRPHTEIEFNMEDWKLSSKVHRIS
jgi:hypothetical protein